MEIMKAGRKFAVVEGDEALVYLDSKREAQAWIDRVIARQAEDEAWERETRLHRLEAAFTYLARRARRPVEIQLNLF